MFDRKFDATAWQDTEKWKADREAIQDAAFKNDTLNKLGLSGAQFGAATQLAARLYMDGPRKIMNAPEIEDRKIQVQRTFPGK
jgi:hypothetical protein